MDPLKMIFFIAFVCENMKWHRSKVQVGQEGLEGWVLEGTEGGRITRGEMVTNQFNRLEE